MVKQLTEAQLKAILHDAKNHIFRPLKGKQYLDGVEVEIVKHKVDLDERPRSLKSLFKKQED